LLDPTLSTWADHFVVNGDSLLANSGRDAVYTSEAYDFNDHRKVELRKKRRLAISDCVELLRDAPSRISRLLNTAHRLTNDSEAIRVLIGDSKSIWQSMALAQRELDTYKSVPVDAPTKCRCKSMPDFRDPYLAKSPLLT
jgi:hypothetical protein